MGGLAFLSEIPTWLQWVGVGLNLVGILLYFAPFGFKGNQAIGLGIVVIGLLANATAAIIGRKLNKARKVGPLIVTGLSMGVGSSLMLLTRWFTEPRIALSGTNLLITLWLAVVNTAFAFTIWNYTQQTLKAMESSMINGAMIIFVVIGATIFLGEKLDVKGFIGLFVAGIGAVLVQLKGNNGVNRQSGI
jgi:drug/metabolite transporter (DMT)-like permease